MTTLAIETRIKERGYQSPNRARSGIKRSKGVSPSVKKRLLALVDEWESEGATDTVVAGVPEGEFEPVTKSKNPRKNGTPAAMTGSIVNAQLAPMPDPEPPLTAPQPSPKSRQPDGKKLAEPLVVNMNCRVRARLTAYGVALLFNARHRVPVPDDLMEKQGVWETQLWQFMNVMGEHLTKSEASPTVDFKLEFITLGL